MSLRNAMKAQYIILGLVVVLLVAACGCTTQNPYGTPTPTATQTTTPTQTSIGTTGTLTVTQTPGTMAVTIQNFAFNPASVTLSRGSTVTWTNQDSTAHQIINDATAAAGQGQLFESNPLSQGQSYSFTFQQAGTFPYHCNIHPSMKGTIIVQ